MPSHVPFPDRSRDEGTVQLIRERPVGGEESQRRLPVHLGRLRSEWWTFEQLIPRTSLITNPQQHSPGIANGNVAAFNFLTSLNWPAETIHVMQLGFKGDLSWMQYTVSGKGEITDQFRWKDGCIVEHVSEPAELDRVASRGKGIMLTVGCCFAVGRGSGHSERGKVLIGRCLSNWLAHARSAELKHQRTRAVDGFKVTVAKTRSGHEPVDCLTFKSILHLQPTGT